jgi:hypothetical protein
LADARGILSFLFDRHTDAVLWCLDAADVDDDGEISISDPIYLCNWLQLGGPPPPPPFDRCGEDPTEDGLECETSNCGTFQQAFAGSDGIIIVIEGTKSMVENGGFSIVRQQVRLAVDKFEHDIQFVIHAFGGMVTSFPPSGTILAATPSVKEGALAFLAALEPMEGSCPHLGLLEALESLELSTVKANAIVYVGNAQAECEERYEATYLLETLETVTRENHGRARIQAISVLNPAKLGEAFLKALAARNGGEYWRILR